MNRFGKVAIGVAGGFAALTGIGWIGLHVPPANLDMPHDAHPVLDMVAVPNGLPAPVQRYYDVAFGERVPRIDSMVVYGRARANFGIWLPLRYRLSHRPGHTFERYMEITWFGLPILKAVDRYVNGAGATGPVGNEATGPAIDQGANMILWAEAPLMPSLWISDERIRWEAIDDEAARLHFPFSGRENGDGTDELIVHFDPATGLVDHITAQRYRDAESGKVPWRVDFLSWQTVHGVQVPARVAVAWADQGEPWSYWDFEYLFWNVDVWNVDGAETATDRNSASGAGDRDAPLAWNALVQVGVNTTADTSR